MAKDTKVADKSKTDTAPLQGAPAANLPAPIKLRLPYSESFGEYIGIDKRQWGVLLDAIWPSAKTFEGVSMALNYCKARNLDPFKKVVHIVPTSVKGVDDRGKTFYREIETVWPGIAEVRITATRTGEYAGKDAAEFGPDVTKTFRHVDDRDGETKKEQEVTFPEWCRVTVYKIVKGVRCGFVGPIVYWEEAYATEGRFSDIPNDMWASRKSGQLEKCAEAAALRAAFPEELGSEPTAEEMHGRVLDQAPPNSVAVTTGAMMPPRPSRSAFERKFDEQDKGKPAADPTPEPTPPQPEIEPEPEPEVADAGPSDAFAAAQVYVEKASAALRDMPADERGEFRARIRDYIAGAEGVTDDERDILRGQFQQAFLEAQRGTRK